MADVSNEMMLYSSVREGKIKLDRLTDEGLKAYRRGEAEFKASSSPMSKKKKEKKISTVPAEWDMLAPLPSGAFSQPLPSRSTTPALPKVDMQKAFQEASRVVPPTPVSEGATPFEKQKFNEQSAKYLGKQLQDQPIYTGTPPVQAKAGTIVKGTPENVKARQQVLKQKQEFENTAKEFEKQVIENNKTIPQRIKETLSDAKELAKTNPSLAYEQLARGVVNAASLGLIDRLVMEERAKELDKLTGKQGQAVRNIGEILGVVAPYGAAVSATGKLGKVIAPLTPKAAQVIGKSPIRYEAAREAAASGALNLATQAAEAPFVDRTPSERLGSFATDVGLGGAFGAVGGAITKGIGKLSSPKVAEVPSAPKIEDLPTVVSSNRSEISSLLTPSANAQSMKKPVQTPRVEDLFEERLLKDTVPAPASRVKIVMMKIDDFLKLVPPLGSIEKKAAGDIVKSGGKLNSLPMLEYKVDGKVGKVVAHEGRHRALALKEAGYTEMPVEIHSPNIRWSEQLDPNNRDYVPEFPEKLVQQGSDRTQSIAFPIKREDSVNVMNPSRKQKQVDGDLLSQQNKNISQSSTTPPTAKNVNPISLADVNRTVSNGLRITIRKGYIGNPNALGVFKIQPEVVRMQTRSDIDTIAHEVGHNLDKRYDLANRANYQEMIDFVNKYSPRHLSMYPQKEHIFEAIAEYFRLHLSDPVRAKQMNSNFYDLVMSSLSKKDLKGLSKSVDAVQRWLGQTEVQRGIGLQNFESSPNTFLGKIFSTPFWKDLKEGGLNEALFDENIRLAKAEAAILNPKLRGEIPEAKLENYLGEGAESPYKMARMYAATPRQVMLFIENNLNPIIKEANKSGVDLQELTTYAIAKHTINSLMRNIETGMSFDQASAIISQLKSPIMDKLQKKLVSYNNKLLVLAVKNGLVSAKDARKMLADNPNYVPLQRFFLEKETSEGMFMDAGMGEGNKSFVDVMKPSSFQRREGSKEILINPIEAMVKNTNSIIDAIERNKIGQSFAKLTEKDGKLRDATGAFIERVSEATASSNSSNIIKVYFAGKPVYFALDPALYAVLKRMSPNSSSVVQTITAKMAQFVRNAVVLTPSFIIKQFLVDELNMVLSSSDYLYKPYWDTIKGLGMLFSNKPKNKALVEEWINNNGAYGSFFSQDRRSLQTIIDRMRTDKTLRQKVGQFVGITLENLKEIVQSPENARRLIVFQKAKEAGRSAREAAYISRDILDYQRRGSLSKEFTTTSAFLNANIQGKNKLYREFRKNPTQFLTKAATLLTIPTIGLYFWNRKFASESQKEQINNAPSWMRDTYFLVAVPGTDIVARYPKPYDVSWAFSNPTEEMLRMIDKNDPRSLDEFARNQAEGSFPALYTGIMPALSYLSGIDIRTKTPIVPESIASRLPEDQYDAYTTELSKWVGKTFGTSPKELDYLIRAYGGDYALIGADITDKNETSQSVLKKWFVDPVVYPKGKYQSDNVKKFYENYEDVRKAVQSAKFTKEPVKNAEKYGVLSSGYGAIRNQQRMIYQIEQDLNLVASEKRDRIAKLRSDMDKIAREANKVYRGE